MKHIILLVASILLFTNLTSAQNNINGNVLLKNGDKAVGVTITLKQTKS